MARGERKDKHFLKQPIYIGGKAAMDRLLKQTMIYPKEALKNKIEGSVYLRYTIDHKGKVAEAKVLSSLGHGCDEEAKRLVKLFTFQIPKIPYKTKVTFQKNIRIHFKLPKKTKKPVIQKAINYTVSKKNIKKEPPKPKSGKSGYSYTISW